MNTELKGLFLNTSEANCSIYESGKMSFNSLALSKKYTIDYQEIDENSRTISLEYDFFVFNYHRLTMGWLNTDFIKRLPGFKATIVLEVLQNDPFVMCSKFDFDAYLVLDPTLQTINSNVYEFPRPLEVANTENRYIEKNVPIIGTFGFATKGKGFDKVIEAINKEFDKAIIRINIPKGDYVSEGSLIEMVNELKSYPLKDEIKLIITNNFFDKDQLIEWCKQNTLNVFLYNRNVQGLSATTDQAISSGRPLAISTDNTFRHIHQYLMPYPFQSLGQSIENSRDAVISMQRDWHPYNFAIRFEKVLKDFHILGKEKTKSTIALPIKKQKQNSYRLTKFDFIPPIFIKIARRIRTKLISERPKSSSQNVLQPFIHYSLKSFSQFNEDLLIDLLLGNKQKGFYIDVGANNPSFNSNTKRFYLRGWRGINIEPDKKAFDKVNEFRKEDLNFNVAISDQEGELSFYNLYDDSTLSTLDFATAEKMSKFLNLTISTTKVKTIPLSKILEQNVNGSFIDFMSVDAEGFDLSVLKSNNWNKFRPSLIIIESNNDFLQIFEFMDSKDYLHVFSNLYNAIFVDKRTKNADLLNNIKWEN